MGIAVAATLHAGAALVILAALSLIGFAAMPAAIRPRRAALSIPASLAAGTLAFGWTAWLAGTFIGTRAIVPLFVAAAIASLPRLRAWTRDLGRFAVRVSQLARASLVATIALALLVIACAPQLLLPLVDSDGLAYHVALPKLFLLTGHVWYVPWTFASALPQTIEMTYLVALRVAGGETAKFIHFGFFLAALATLAVAVHRPRMRSAAMIAPLLFAAAPVVLAPAAAAFTDHAAMFFIITAALLLFRGASPLVAGIALGAAIATKVTVAPAVAGLIIYGVWTSFPAGVLTSSQSGVRTGFSRSRRLQPALMLLVPIIMAFLPFAIRNIRHTGDPVYPIGYILLHRAVPGIPAERVAYASQFHSSVPGPLGIAWMPDPEHAQPDEVAGLHHVIGLFALALTIGFRWTRRWLALVLPPLLLAVFFHPPTRLLLPMFAGLAALEAYALVVFVGRFAPSIASPPSPHKRAAVSHERSSVAASISSSAVIVRRATEALRRHLASGLAVVAAAPAAVTAIVLMLTTFAPADLLLGRSSREQFLRTRVPGYAAAEIVNQQPPGGWVMALDFPTPYYFDRPWIAEGMLNEPPLREWIARASSADDVVKRLHAADIRYIVITPGYGAGTNASLLPLAQNAREAATIVALRRRLNFVAGVGRVEVVGVFLTRQHRDNK